MSDQEALRILRKVEPPFKQKDPDIEVVVGTEEAPAQTEIPLGLSVYKPRKAWGEVRKISTFEVSPTSFEIHKESPHEYPQDPPRVVIGKADLNSPIRAVLNRGDALRVVEDAFGKGESLRMRLLLDRSTIDIDLSRDVSDGLEATFHDLIDRSLG